MPNIVTAVAQAISSVFGWMTDRQKANNADDIKAAEIAKQEQVAKDKINKAIEERNTDEIRKSLSE